MRGVRPDSITMIGSSVFLLSALAIGATVGHPTNSHQGTHGVPIPPKALHHGVYPEGYNAEAIAERVKSWKPEDKSNVWELSGLYQGDIMIDTDSKIARNGLVDKAARWPGGIVPFSIEEKYFNKTGIARIKAAINEFHQKTCLRFRPYKETDEDYVLIKGTQSGCWSYVGRRGHEQVLNLQNPACLEHGVIVHEIMHALGFFHQHSATDRDDFITIHWENIESGAKINFEKFAENIITDFGVGYDYGSVLHYSAYAASKNGKPTIVPIKKGAKIGQRVSMSEKDVKKLQAMYKEECGDRKPQGTTGGSE